MMAARGYGAAAVFQPGYGNSDGAPHFCGPFTQDAVLVAIDFLRNKTFVNPNKVVLFGYSRGAIAASMVATKDQNLAPVILGLELTIYLNGIQLIYVALIPILKRRREPHLKLVETGQPSIM